MRMKRRLTRKQLAVLDDLFSSDGSVSESAAGGILEKHGVSAADYRRWHSEEAFSQEYEARLAALGRQSRLLIARYASYAAAKLIALTESENQETARKACLDIIDRIQNTEHRIQNNEELTEGGCEGASLTPELAEKILESLADRE
jgi:primosomal protein N''